ncbi:uncharacterized protein LOC8271351 isoform X1 [Ricinus communis]|uniref:uncharacterized protein LOC8271351 isoform X1 n=1 Tax=Ricinus communis TaxID=3988 RepID=UPI000D6897ED|nr:uncharacterized protein LOC8271351 isoform X1 [Ricinus communis]|eukprot:XP_025012827.1 uncharacterized protein LOC8271351 isoform X1 [Ricinus communis]
MERYTLNFTLFSLHILLFTLFLCSPTASSQDGICASIFCGQGTCKNINASFLDFECECNSGWKKIQIGPLTFPSCLLPNCTTDLQCGNGSPPPPPPPPPSTALPPPQLNLTNPCNLIWCADGTCMPNGTGHICRCNQGSANLINDTKLPCFQECYLGTDCDGLGLLPPGPSEPPSPNSGSNNGSQPPPPPSTSDSAGNGPSKVLLSWRNLGALAMILLAATSTTLV